MRYLVGFVFVLLALAAVGCNAPDLVVQVCERDFECRPPSQPIRPVEDCVESTRLRMQCLTPSETAGFLDEVAVCLEMPCEYWFRPHGVPSCPPRLAPCPLDGPCVAPLADYCVETECPTWDEELARIECPGNWEVGTCGGFRYVWHQFWGYADYYVRYFDASGTLVIQEAHSDANTYCDSTSWEIFYGQVPDCELEPTVLSREDCRSATP